MDFARTRRRRRARQARRRSAREAEGRVSPCAPRPRCSRASRLYLVGELGAVSARRSEIVEERLAGLALRLCLRAALARTQRCDLARLRRAGETHGLLLGKREVDEIGRIGAFEIEALR